MLIGVFYYSLNDNVNMHHSCHTCKTQTQYISSKKDTLSSKVLHSSIYLTLKKFKRPM